VVGVEVFMVLLEPLVNGKALSSTHAVADICELVCRAGHGVQVNHPPCLLIRYGCPHAPEVRSGGFGTWLAVVVAEKLVVFGFCFGAPVPFFVEEPANATVFDAFAVVDVVFVDFCAVRVKVAHVVDERGDVATKVRVRGHFLSLCDFRESPRQDDLCDEEGRAELLELLAYQATRRDVRAVLAEVLKDST
jgi:hypothetical protein